MQIIQVLIGGLAQGCVYGLVALSFVLIYKATDTVSFVQGELLMFGAFGCFIGVSVLHLPLAAAVVGSVAVTAALGMLLERVAVRRLLGQPPLAVIMLTIGLGYVLRGGVSMLPEIGTQTQRIELPYGGQTWRLAELVIGLDQVAVIVGTTLLCGLMYAMFRFTRVGIAMQAMSQNQLAAVYMGIPVARMNGLVWGLAAAVAAVAGLLLAPITFVYSDMGSIGLKALPAAVLGGFGSLPGALVGGLVVGVTEALAGFFLPEGFKDVAAYVLLLAMLMVRPAGLFGVQTGKKV